MFCVTVPLKSPVVQGVDVITPGAAVTSPQVAMVEQPGEDSGTASGIVGRKQNAGHAGGDQRAVAADIAGGGELALRHGFKRLERGDKFGQAAALARIGHDVAQGIIAVDLMVRHPADEANGSGSRRGLGLLPQRSEEHTSELQSLMRITYAVY